VTALADDGPGREVAGLLAAAGVRVADLKLLGPTPEKIRVREGRRTLFRLDRNCADVAPVGEPGDDALAALHDAAAVLVSDYGRGVASADAVRAALARLGPHTPVVWDPHPRGALPVAGARLVTPNRSEAAQLAPDVEGTGLAAQAERARRLRRQWGSAAVAVTMGSDGALLVDGDGVPLVAPAPAVGGGDPCGAGDRFASAATSLLAGGAVLSEAVVGAVEAAAAFVAAGGAGAVRFGDQRTQPVPPDAPGRRDAHAVVAAVRSRGGTVVATGGCFDVLHAGHVSLLEGARALGDCLVVCLNSDESVRRLKGQGRPRSSQADRAAVLLALRCVDAVAVFDEDLPTAVLNRLRPDVWVKGGDYAGGELPETDVVAGWGGQAVVLPYLAGRSTTRLLEEV
jgi:rfaE bifunctional protein nucleotidyltransferase chain/domain